MTAADETTSPRGGRAGKPEAILSGALTVFARDGYTRAGVDTIAKEAGVSTRTIYNHFDDKAGLFDVLIRNSATAVAEAQIEIVRRHLSSVDDLEADLAAFGRAWATPVPDHARHFALVRHINADAAHIPQATVEAWQQAGPLRVRRELAAQLRRLADRGLLRVTDPETAANHLVLLTTVANPSLPNPAQRTEAEAEHTVTAGVHAFLYGYAVR